MAANTDDELRKRLLAQADDPEIRVHVLGEFVYCARAGLCAFEQDCNEGEEAEEPNLDYYPRYELDRMERALEQLKPSVYGWGIPAAVVAMLTVVFAFTQPVEVTGLGLVVLAGIGVKLGPPLWKAAQIAWSQYQFAHATAREPDLGRSGNQPVNWWELQQAGFHSMSYQDPLVDPDAKLRGKPWRVLRRGSLRIPVFRKLQGDNLIRPQQVVRVTAYCRLLEACEGAQSPYGIVLLGKSYVGVAVPQSRENGESLCEHLLRARSEVRKSLETPEEFLGLDSHRDCSNCPLGKPVVHRPGETEHVHNGRALPVCGVWGPDERRYHSHCGDRFRWVPPHDKADKKGLTRKGSRSIGG